MTLKVVSFTKFVFRNNIYMILDYEPIVFGLLPENVRGFEISGTDGILRISGETLRGMQRLIGWFYRF